MSELTSVLDELIRLADRGDPSALCSVVATKGSTPQCPGATMLLRSDFTTLGTLGGGCVEAEVRKQAFELLSRSESGLLDFVLDHDYGWDDGLICGGRMQVGVMTIDPKAELQPFRDALGDAQRHRPAFVPLRVKQEGKPLEFRLHLEAPPTLLIAGAGHVGHALARLAADLDFRVVVVDDRADCASRERFGPKVELIVQDIAAALKTFSVDASTYVVIVTRGHQRDHQALDAVIRRPARYIGLIGSKRKARMIFEDLRSAGVTDEQLARVHTPIGLDIDAVLVPEIAVSIAAQLVQERRRTTPKLIEGPFEPTGWALPSDRS